MSTEPHDGLKLVMYFMVIGWMVVVFFGTILPYWNETGQFDLFMSEDQRHDHMQDVVCLLDASEDGLQVSEIVGLTDMGDNKADYILRQLYQDDVVRYRSVELGDNHAKVWRLNTDITGGQARCGQ